MACTNGFCSTFQYTTIFYVDWKPTQYIQQYVLKHHCCIQLIEYTFVTKGLFFTHTWKVAANLNSLASEVSPAMATPTWLSIERIFFWWADSSDAALCWGRSNIQVKFNRQQGQVPNWSGTAPSGHHDIIASFLIPTGQTPLKFLVWKPYSWPVCPWLKRITMVQCQSWLLWESKRRWFWFRHRLNYKIGGFTHFRYEMRFDLEVDKLYLNRY